ncbi:DUF6332 family protein [Streptomyces sp. NPDC005141]
MGDQRTQAQKDDVTVETMYVAISAVILAGAAFLVVASPALLFDAVHGDARRGVVIGAKGVGAAVFLARLITGLWRW